MGESQQYLNRCLKIKSLLKKEVINESYISIKDFTKAIKNLKRVSEEVEQKPLIGFFVHGKSYRSEIYRIAEYLQKSQVMNIVIFIGERVQDKLERLPNSFIIIPCDKYVCNLENLDAIITTTPIRESQLPVNSIKIYLTHDIADSPLGDIKHQVEHLSHYDLIATAGEVSNRQFEDLVENHIKKIKSITGSISCTPIGYPKVDRLANYCKNIIPEKNNIIICPTYVMKLWKEYLLNKEFIQGFLENLSKYNLNYKITFRPHPNSRECDSLKEFQSYQENHKFKNLDLSINRDIDYANLYAKSSFMITDFSGTASTYMAAFRKPAFFYVPHGFPKETGKYVSERLAEKGLTFTNLNELVKVTAQFSSTSSQIFNKNIESIRNELTCNHGNSLESLSITIMDIIKSHKDSGKLTFRRKSYYISGLISFLKKFKRNIMSRK